MNSATPRLVEVDGAKTTCVILPIIAFQQRPNNTQSCYRNVAAIPILPQSLHHSFPAVCFPTRLFSYFPHEIPPQIISVRRHGYLLRRLSDPENVSTSQISRRTVCRLRQLDTPYFM